MADNYYSYNHENLHFTENFIMTQQWTNLSNAPIVEAIVEFQFSVSDDVTFEMLQEVADALKADYPKQEEKRSSIFKAVIKSSGPETEVHDGGLVGISAKSSDNKNIVQLFRDRFSFSQLPPYQNWELLEKQAIEIWKVFLAKTKIDGINRVGVRFINKIEIDLPFDDFNDYIVGAPTVPKGLPQSLSAFDMRLIIPNKDIDADGIVNMSMNGFDRERNVVPVILDVDVGKAGPIRSDEESLHDILVELRNYKNELFFHNITDKVVRKYA